MYTGSVGLSQEAVVGAGVSVVADLGWSALSTRAVAGLLGVTPMALYRHIDNSDVLANLVLDRIVSDSARVQLSDALDIVLSTWARSTRAHLAKHPGVAGRLITHWFECGPMLDRIDELLEACGHNDVVGFSAVALVNAVFMHVLMRVEAEGQVMAAGVVRRQLNLASAERPLRHLRALIAHYTTAQFDAHFEYGLSALLADARGTVRS
jgi:AcrR family transcriptional regulator